MAARKRLVAQAAQADLAAAALGAGPRDRPWRSASRPIGRRVNSNRCSPQVAGRRATAARTAVPAHRVDRVQHAPRPAGERLAFPLARPVEVDRHRIVEAGRVVGARPSAPPGAPSSRCLPGRSSARGARSARGRSRAPSTAGARPRRFAAARRCRRFFPGSARTGRPGPPRERRRRRRPSNRRSAAAAHRRPTRAASRPGAGSRTTPVRCRLVDGDQVFPAVAVEVRRRQADSRTSLVGDDALAEPRQPLPAKRRRRHDPNQDGESHAVPAANAGPRSLRKSRREPSGAIGSREIAARMRVHGRLLDVGGFRNHGRTWAGRRPTGRTLDALLLSRTAPLVENRIRTARAGIH